MALYRLICALGQQSLVAVLTRCGLPLPAYFLADEQHSHCLTEKIGIWPRVYVTVPACIHSSMLCYPERDVFLRALLFMATRPAWSWTSGGKKCRRDSPWGGPRLRVGRPVPLLVPCSRRVEGVSIGLHFGMPHLLGVGKNADESPTARTYTDTHDCFH
jgi:hypothetical protein